MTTETACPGCGFLMSANALSHHYPFVHGPRPQLLPDFIQPGDGLTRCLAVTDEPFAPWSLQEHRPAPPEPTTAPHQPALL